MAYVSALSGTIAPRYALPAIRLSSDSHRRRASPTCAGLAAIALGGAGVGIGTIFGNYLAGALRNPAAAASQRGTLFLGFAFAEATGLIGFAVAMLILFG